MLMDDIADAIRKRQVLKLWYDGGERIVEPHRVGYGSNGNAKLSCYQTSGFSRSGNHEGWKPFLLAKIRNCEPTGDSFEGVRDGYNKEHDRAIPRVVEEL